MRLHGFFGIFASVALVGSNPTQSAAQTPQSTMAIDANMTGRWDISFRSPEANVDTVWVIERGADDTLSIGTLGQNSAGLAVRTAAFSGDSLTLSGTSAAGPLVMVGTRSGDRLVGEFTAGPISGTFLAARRKDNRTRDLTALFDDAIDTFTFTLFTPVPFDAAWQARRAEMRAQLQNPGTTERDMVRAVRTLIAAARLSHNDFYLPVSANEPVQAMKTVPAVTWQRLETGEGYIRISHFVDASAERDRLDEAFAELKNANGLIIDLMDNSGGDLGLAMRLGDHLLLERTNGGLFATRKGLAAAGVTSMEGIPKTAFTTFDGYDTAEFQDALSRSGAVTLVTGGRAPHFAGPVALLINGSSGSSSEAVAAMMKETGRARLFGTRSAGKMLSSRTIAQQDGYILRVAFADYRTPKGTVAEKIGVTPDQTVIGDGADVLAAAIKWLSKARS